MITHFTYYKGSGLITLRVSTAQEMMRLVRNASESNLEYKGGFWHVKDGQVLVNKFQYEQKRGMEDRGWPEFVEQFEHWNNQLELWHGEEEAEA